MIKLILCHLIGDYVLQCDFIAKSNHVIIDLLKARYKKIDYKTDQILHYIVLVILWLV